TIYAITTAAGGSQPTLRRLVAGDVGDGAADTVVDSNSLRNGNGLVVVPDLEGMTNGTVDAAVIADGDNGLVRVDAENGGDVTRFAPSRFIRGVATALVGSTRYVAVADDGEGIRIYRDPGDGSFPRDQLAQEQSTSLRGLSFDSNADYLLSAQGAGLTIYEIADASPPIADTGGTGTYENGDYTDGVYHAVTSPLNPGQDLLVAAGPAGLRSLEDLNFDDPAGGSPVESELAATEAQEMRDELLGAEELVTQRVAALLLYDGSSQGEVVVSADGDAGARVVLRDASGSVTDTAIYFADDGAAENANLRDADAGALDPTADTVSAAEGVGEVRDVIAWAGTHDGEELIFAAFASVDEGLLIAEIGTVEDLLGGSLQPTMPVRVREVADARSLGFIDGMLVVAGGGRGTDLVDVTNVARPYVIRNYNQSAFQTDHVVVYEQPGSGDPAADSARIVIAGSDSQDYLEYLEVQNQ
ncbi:MAG: hypothetical protein ACOCYG_08305, partial [Spirochaetota bacterium]